jgi:hypothetical protein
MRYGVKILAISPKQDACLYLDIIKASCLSVKLLSFHNSGRMRPFGQRVPEVDDACFAR